MQKFLFLSVSTLLLILLILLSPGVAIAQSKGNRPSATVRKGISPEEKIEASGLLLKLGYWLEPEGPNQAVSFKHALIAFQKVEGRARTGILNRGELEALRTASPPLPRDSSSPHVEVDLDRQVLFIIDLGNPGVRVLPVSSGSGEMFTEGGVTRQAVTPTGKFKIQRKIQNWRKSPLGLLYFPCYFHDGVAIHGNPAVPVKPASHGCVRIPMFAAEDFSKLAEIGTPVIVY